MEQFSLVWTPKNQYFIRKEETNVTLFFQSNSNIQNSNKKFLYVKAATKTNVFTVGQNVIQLHC